MADGIFNRARGSIAQLHRAGTNYIVVLLKVAEGDDALNNHDDLAALLAGTSDEANFTNYARQTITNANATLTTDDTANTVKLQIGNRTFVNAGGATNNELFKLLVCADGANDAARIPLCHHQLTGSGPGGGLMTDGNTLVIQEPSNGFWGSP